MIRLVFILLFFAQSVSAAEKVVADTSQKLVSITANFDGSSILIFGAVKRDAPPPDGGPLQVIISVTGPSSPVVVRRKERLFGIWVNRDFVNVDLAPSFYAVASTGPLKEVLSDVEDLRNKISIKRMIRSVGAPMNVDEPGKFPQALVRIRRASGLYSETQGGVDLKDQTLFQTEIMLPSNLIEGDYRTRIFLTRGREIVDEFETKIAVRKVGLERWIYNLAHQRPLIYGLLSLAIAIIAGWLASAVFRLLRLN